MFLTETCSRTYQHHPIDHCKVGAGILDSAFRRPWTPPPPRGAPRRGHGAAAAAKERAAAQEEALTAALARQRLEDLREAKEVQRVCEEAPAHAPGPTSFAAGRSLLRGEASGGRRGGAGFQGQCRSQNDGNSPKVSQERNSGLGRQVGSLGASGGTKGSERAHAHHRSFPPPRLDRSRFIIHHRPWDPVPATLLLKPSRSPSVRAMGPMVRPVIHPPVGWESMGGGPRACRRAAGAAAEAADGTGHPGARVAAHPGACAPRTPGEGRGEGASNWVPRSRVRVSCKALFLALFNQPFGTLVSWVLSLRAGATFRHHSDPSSCFCAMHPQGRKPLSLTPAAAPQLQRQREEETLAGPRARMVPPLVGRGWPPSHVQDPTRWAVGALGQRGV